MAKGRDNRNREDKKKKKPKKDTVQAAATVSLRHHSVAQEAPRSPE